MTTENDDSQAPQCKYGGSEGHDGPAYDCSGGLPGEVVCEAHHLEVEGLWYCPTHAPALDASAY